ncbi:hypothetical protein [Chlorobium sp. KB01]|uniref:hypothetical protein n=1 Tax=Chlorobium sp. KB01 TaxID=1917528 RepID=UPI000978481E|nr:hypothetical protein [Chlorobium sp. KB01]
MIKNHYNKTAHSLKRLEVIVEAAVLSGSDVHDRESDKSTPDPVFDPKGKTAAILVNGFNGLGLHTLFSVFRLFGNSYKNYVFVEIGSIDAGNFKGADEIDHLGSFVRNETSKYMDYMKAHGYYSEAYYSIGTDVVDEVNKLVPAITEKFPDIVFFGGQLVFSKESLMDRWLHNYTVFAIQRNLYVYGIPFVILPIKV